MQIKLYLTTSRLSGKPGCQENLGVRKIWMSGKSGCQENLDVRKIWMSEKSGCQQNLDVRKIWVSGKSGCQENPGVRKIWMSGKSGCQKNLGILAIFRLSRRSVFIQTLPSREQGEYKVTNSSWKLVSMDRGTGSRNRELPKIGDEGRGDLVIASSHFQSNP